MFCRPVGAGDSLLLLLRDGVESKGMFSILNCFTPRPEKGLCSCPGGSFPAEQSRDGAVRFGAAVPLFGGVAAFFFFFFATVSML